MGDNLSSKNPLSAFLQQNLVGRHDKAYLPFKMSDVRKLPIVGDVHYAREQWPAQPDDWKDLLGISPLPIKLSQIIYSVNESEQAFDSLGLKFSNQKFESAYIANPPKGSQQRK